MSKIEDKAIFSLSYGLFLLSTNLEGFDNGCIVNTVQQVTANPLKISVAVNKANLTAELISRSGKFNVSVLDTTAPFYIFQQFGFVSGKERNKFRDAENISRSENGLCYLNKFTNAYISATVVKEVDMGSHIIFFAEVTEAKALSENPSMTYSYYFSNVKPKPEIKEEKKGYVCKICGYVYEGEPLPEDFICPICKHGAEDFEKI